MKKREFLKFMGVATASLVASGTLMASKKKKDTAGKWKNDAGNKHTPVVKTTRSGDTVKLELDTTKHPQSEDHFIDYLEVYSSDKKKLFSAKIDSKSGVSKVSCHLKLAKGTKVYAVSHCNKHDYYQREVTV
ncbi:MAG: hypothetical protein COA79_03940 [Planctomycetota bacterium]|nr:MAG: hypothetical protein COA79_03940 [Planctomycetota bacterium]